MYQVGQIVNLNIGGQVVQATMMVHTDGLWYAQVGNQLYPVQQPVQQQPINVGGISAPTNGITGSGLFTNPGVPVPVNPTICKQIIEDISKYIAAYRANLLPDDEATNMTSSLLSVIDNELKTVSEKSIVLKGSSSNPNFSLEIGVMKSSTLSGKVPFVKRYDVYGAQSTRDIELACKSCLNANQYSYAENTSEKYKESFATIEKAIDQLVQQYVSNGSWANTEFTNTFSSDMVTISYGGITISPTVKGGHLEFVYSIDPRVSMTVVKSDVAF
ncbi:MAG: hypothetical protein ACRC92_26010 [Peptostreptococcaceae bacterium]